MALFFLKRYQEAHGAMLKFAQTYPNAPEAPEALYRAAEALFVDPEKQTDAQQNEAAKTLYEQFIRRYQENADVRRLAADASLRVGQCLFRLKRLDEARLQLEKVIQRYPEIEAAEDAHSGSATRCFIKVRKTRRCMTAPSSSINGC